MSKYLASPIHSSILWTHQNYEVTDWVQKAVNAIITFCQLQWEYFGFCCNQAI